MKKSISSHLSPVVQMLLSPRDAIEQRKRRFAPHEQFTRLDHGFLYGIQFMLSETHMRGRSLFTSLPSHQLNQACRGADQDLVTHAPKLSCAGEAPHPCA
jgi:hypothetical protein